MRSKQVKDNGFERSLLEQLMGVAATPETSATQNIGPPKHIIRSLHWLLNTRPKRHFASRHQALSRTILAYGFTAWPRSGDYRTEHSPTYQGLCLALQNTISIFEPRLRRVTLAPLQNTSQNSNTIALLLLAEWSHKNNVSTINTHAIFSQTQTFLTDVFLTNTRTQYG